MVQLSRIKDMSSSGSFPSSSTFMVAFYISLVISSCYGFTNNKLTCSTHRSRECRASRRPISTFKSKTTLAEYGNEGFQVHSPLILHNSATSNLDVIKASSSSEAPQILTFKEPSTNVTVMLIGAMHYNPSSIQLTQDTLLDLKSKGNLGSVVIETCDVRWTSSSADKNITAEELIQRQKMSKFLKNEMRTAYDVAHGLLEDNDDSTTKDSPSLSSVPVILGDQRINITATRMKEVAQETVWDLATPLGGGWKRFYNDMKANIALALPQNDDTAITTSINNNNNPKYIDARGFLDPRLLLAMPVTLLKYPLSWFVRAPLGSAVAATLFLVLNFIADHTSSPFEGYYNFIGAAPAAAAAAASATATTSSTVGAGEIVPSMVDWVGSLMFAVLETAVLGRILIKALLAERNVVLADNILHQCQLVASRRGSTGNKALAQPQQQSKNNPFGSLWNLIFEGFQEISSSGKQQQEQQGTTLDSTNEMIYYAMPPTTPKSITLAPSPPTLTALSSMSWSGAATSEPEPPSVITMKDFDLRKLQSVVKAIPRDKDDGIGESKSFINGFRNENSVVGNDPTVVAVLGMAHCNGIMKIMLETQETGDKR